MRQLLPVLALVTAFIFSARAADKQSLITNTVSLSEHGTLEIPIPKDWTLTHTNMQLRGDPTSVELHSASNTVAIRVTIYWDGFGSKKPTDADMETVVSNGVVLLYLPFDVEKTFTLEKLQGPGVTGVFARFTDAGWTPMVKDEFRNLATGMFRSGNLWGNFDLLSNDKDGPSFQQGLKVMQSLRRQP